MSITTRAGDGGQTDLMGGIRVSKTDPRVICCGDIDELNAALGLARSLCRDADVRGRIEAIQSRLFVLAGELAGGEAQLTEVDVTELEAVTDHAMEGVGGVMRFVTPGADPGSAAIHLARAVARRAERDLVVCSAAHRLRPVLLSYLNRLSDALYALARLEEKNAGEG